MTAQRALAQLPWHRYGAQLFSKSGFAGTAATPAIAEMIVVAVNNGTGGAVHVPQKLYELLWEFVIARDAGRTPPGRGVYKIREELEEWTKQNLPAPATALPRR